MNISKDKPFLIFKSRDSYEEARAREDVRNDAIVFIREDGTIWTHGYMFGGGVEHAKGFFKSVDLLPSGVEGDWAVVNVEGQWFIYTYGQHGWESTDSYDMGTGPIDFDKTYVRYDTIRDYLKDIYNNVYVRKDEVWSPEGWWSGTVDPGESSEEPIPIIPNQGGGSSTTVDNQMSSLSWNPVANNVIYRYLHDKTAANENKPLDGFMHELDQKYVSYEDFESAVMASSGIVDRLNDYYTKNETYTKSEIDARIRQVPTFKTVVVDTLPVISSAEEGVIYIVKDQTGDAAFTEYLFNDGNWVELGSQTNDIKLEGYATEDWVTQYFCNASDYYTKVYIDANYYSKSQVDNKLDLTVKKAEVYTPNSEVAPSMPQADMPGSNPWRRVAASSPIIDDETEPVASQYVTWKQMQDYIAEHSNDQDDLPEHLKNIPNHIILEQTAYEALSEYAANTLYFVLEPQENINWTFGGTFPVTFAAEGLGTFPITFATEGLGTFPINLT